MKLANHVINIKLDCLVPALKEMCMRCFTNKQVKDTLAPHIEHVIRKSAEWILRPDIGRGYVELDVKWPSGEESWVVMS